MGLPQVFRRGWGMGLPHLQCYLVVIDGPVDSFEQPACCGHLPTLTLTAARAAARAAATAASATALTPTLTRALQLADQMLKLLLRRV